MALLRRILLSCLIALLAAPVFAAQPEKKRPRIALVLEGGGALGFAHVGALQYLKDHHIPVDLVVGTSMGGLVGGLYASGMSPEEIRTLVEGIDWDRMLGGRTPFTDMSYRRKEDRADFANRLVFGLRHGVSLPNGFNSGHDVGLLLDKLMLPTYSFQSFDDLPTPFRCVATNLTTGRKKVFGSGPLSPALRATMSIPGVFAPVTIGGDLYADGAAVDNLPVDVAKELGADIVIAVYLDTGPSPAKLGGSFLATAGRTISIMVAANEARSLAMADLVIDADVSRFTSSSFKEAEQIMPAGYAAAQKKSAMLDRLALDPADWEAYLARRRSRIRTTVPVPRFVAVTGSETASNRAMQKELAPFAGRPVNTQALATTLTRFVGYGSLNSAGYRMEERNGVPGLLVTAHPKLYGPPFVNVGFLIDGSEPADTGFGMAARVTFNNLGGFRSELRTDGFFGTTYGAKGEYYRPLTPASGWFVAPRAYATTEIVDLYNEQNRTSQFAVGNSGFGVDAGYTWPLRGEIRAGEDLLWYSMKNRINADDLPSFSERQTVASLRYNFFGTDNSVLPLSGLNLKFSIENHQQLDGGTPFTKAELRSQYFQPLNGKSSAFVTASGGSGFGAATNDLGLQGFTLGGPFRMSAYGKNELLGNQYFLFQAGYERKLMDVNPLIGEGLYGLVFAEGGKMYDNFSTLDPAQPADGAIAFVLRTALGPIYLGGSAGSSGHGRWWFGLGHVF